MRKLFLATVAIAALATPAMADSYNMNINGLSQTNNQSNFQSLTSAPTQGINQTTVKGSGAFSSPTGYGGSVNGGYQTPNYTTNYNSGWGGWSPGW